MPASSNSISKFVCLSLDYIKLNMLSKEKNTLLRSKDKSIINVVEISTQVFRARGIE